MAAAACLGFVKQEMAPVDYEDCSGNSYSYQPVQRCPLPERPAKIRNDPRHVLGVEIIRPGCPGVSAHIVREHGAGNQAPAPWSAPA